jgi:cystathionine gamma-synthase
VTNKQRPGPNTRSVHAGVRHKRSGQTIATPITQTALYTFADSADLRQFMQSKTWGEGTSGREEYARYGNPSVHIVEEKLAALEGGESALLFASGMAAITTLLLASLPTGAHVVITDDCYRRTRQFCLTFLKRLGIETTMVPAGDYPAIEAAIIPKKTRFIISESPTNPYLRLADFEILAEVAQRYKVRTLIDGTFGTPINQHPLQHGIDYVVHSATKYLSGHHDMLGGVIIGSKNRVTALREAQGVMGSVIAPQNAYLLERGLKTLGLRVQQQNQNGLRIAEFLENHPQIEQVWYPGLASHPDHDLAVKQMSGFGGVVSFTVRGDNDTAAQFIDALSIPYIAPSLGGTESLIEQPAIMSYYEMAPEDRVKLGIPDNLVRFSAGIEDTADLIADFSQALDQLD